VIRLQNEIKEKAIMTISNLLNLSGLILNVFGTILLAVSLSKYLTSFHGAIAIHDMTLKGLVKRDNKILFADDMGALLIKGASNGKKRTMAGLVLVCIGFIFQLLPILIDIFKLQKVGQ
jgi:hypothetical protein